MEKNYKKQLLRADPATLSLVEFLEHNEGIPELKGAHVYADFPLYKEEGEVVSADVAIVSPSVGLLIFATTNATDGRAAEDVPAAEARGDRVFTHLFSRLIKSKLLQSGRTSLCFPMRVAIYAPDLDSPYSDSPADVLRSAGDLHDFISDEEKLLDADVIQEVISVVQGAKGLLKPKDRNLKGLPS